MKDDAKPDQPGYKYARRDPSETREDAIEYLKSQGLNPNEVIASGLNRIKEVEDLIKNGIMKHPTDEEIEKKVREIYRNRMDQGGSEYGWVAPALYEISKWARDQQPKLKTLEEWDWVNDGPDEFTAYTPIFVYFINRVGDYLEVTMSSVDSVDVTHIGKAYHLNEVMQLAQADYERRINELYI